MAEDAIYEWARVARPSLKKSVTRADLLSARVTLYYMVRGERLSVVELEDGEEGFLRDFDAADLLHALLALLLFFEELAFT